MLRVQCASYLLLRYYKLMLMAVLAINSENTVYEKAGPSYNKAEGMA
jgi:hypothetical protein